VYDSKVDKREVRVVDVEERAEESERRDWEREVRPSSGRGFFGGDEGIGAVSSWCSGLGPSI